MPFVLKPGRNPIIRAAFEGLRAEERKAKKQAEPEVPKTAKKAAKKPANKKEATRG
jgi:hypothetical protein